MCIFVINPQLLNFVVPFLIAPSMGKKHGHKFRNNGYLEPQSSSRVIEKNKHNRVPAVPIYARSPAYQGVAGHATGVSSTGHWGTMQGESRPYIDEGPGYIFMCNGKTKADCYRYRVFGLPSARMDILEKIKPYMKLFLFDFDAKLLYGIYVAASGGQLAIEPAAFGGKFSAQVRFSSLLFYNFSILVTFLKCWHFRL